jgi:hypothetical protein
MAPGIGANGYVGIALEVVPGTWVAPTKYVPILSESFKYKQDTQWRRPIRQSADVIGAVAGDSSIEGDISMEALSDCIPYFLYCARTTPVKAGAGPVVYTFTPNALAIPSRTMSITVVRNGLAMGYSGVVVSDFTFSIDAGMLKFDCTLLGRDEAAQTLPTATWGISEPFGAGTYSIEIPTATPVLDSDKFDFKVSDGAVAEFRLKNTGRGAAFIRYGERSIEMSVERDFETRTEYDNYKALTAQTVTVKASKGVGESVSILTPVAIKDTYEINGLSGQGDLLRASVKYQSVQSALPAYTIVVTTPTEAIV